MPFASLAAVAILGGAIGLQAEPVQPTFPSPLSRIDAPFSERADVNAVASLVDSNEAAWDQIFAHEIVIVHGIPLGPSIDADAALRRVEALAPGAAIVSMVDDGRGGVVASPIAAPPILFYAGTLLGSEGSRIFLAHGAGLTHGYAIFDGRTFLISSGAPGAKSPIVSYELTALPEDAISWSPFECAAETVDAVPQPEGGLSGALPCRQVKLALDSDNELRNVFGGDVTATAAYLLLQAAAMNEIYAANINTRIQASFVRIWTVDDPWNQGGSVNQLYQFRDYWQANEGAVVRDAAMLLSARNLGGGVAWLSAMCGDFAYSVSGNLAGYFPYPLQNNSGQNWDIIVTSHELGHNMGTTHTHNFCPPVDQCAPSGYYGACQKAQVCTNQGTIMSYCHLCSGGTANVQLTFATACDDAMLEHLGAISCETIGDELPPWAVPDFVSTGSSTISIDVLANDLPVNCGSVLIESFTQPPPGQGTVTRLVGAGPGGRDLLQFTVAGSDPNPVEFTYTPENEGGEIGLAATVRVQKSAYWPATSVVGTQPKIQVKYYDLVAPQSLPDFDALTPYLISTTSFINFPSTGGNFANSNRSDNFGALWTGWVSVPSNGLYTFYLNSDDGSRLLVDGNEIIDNDGLHGMVEKSGIAPLAEGRHAIRVEFFEAGGGAGCILSFSGPGISKTPIPTANFSHGGIVLIADFNLDGAVDGDDLGFLLGQWGSAGPQADLNDDGVVDGNDLGTLLGGWTG
ncbi:MAG: hypothetical protein FJ253_03495 [Phycisphaerae bacterium]|nr:hypothetical protein [Phycisphaerae bacterium]